MKKVFNIYLVQQVRYTTNRIKTLYKMTKILYIQIKCRKLSSNKLNKFSSNLGRIAKNDENFVSFLTYFRQQQTTKEKSKVLSSCHLERIMTLTDTDPTLGHEAPHI